MMRYMLAGLAMTASVVLLFLASFRVGPPLGDGRDSQSGQPVAAVVAGKEADTGAATAGTPAPLSGGPATTDAVAALQEQIRRASQTLASLENQVTQTRQDLASLQSQKASGSPVAPSQVAPSRQQGRSAQPAPSGMGTTVEPGRSTAADGIAAPRPADPTEKPARRPPAGAGQAASNVPSDIVADAGGPGASARSRAADVRSSEPRGVDAALPDPRLARANPPVDVRVNDGDATQAALNKLRRQSAQIATGQGRLDAAGEPHRVPTSERLADARAAVIEGRLEDARRSLQAAQVQLVFRAVGSGEEQPRVSQATGPISQALLALGTGDRGRAIIAIDQASSALDTTIRSRQFGSLPSEDNLLLPSGPRGAP